MTYASDMIMVDYAGEIARRVCEPRKCLISSPRTCRLDAGLTGSGVKQPGQGPWLVSIHGVTGVVDRGTVKAD